jgi:amidase
VPLGWKGRSRPTNIPTDYTKFLDPNGLRGARIGVTRQGVDTAPPVVVAAFDAAIDAIKAAGATVINLDGPNGLGFTFPSPDGELLVLEYEFRNDVQSYFATRVGVPMAGKTLADAIAFNTANADAEMPYFGQDLWEQINLLAVGADAPQPQPPFNGMTYNQALEIDRLSGVNGIDLALQQFKLDAIVAPTDNPAWATDLLYGDHFIFGSSSLAAAEGYPIVQVPAGMVFEIPLGISFFGTAFSEPTLIRLASGFEAVTQVRAKNPPTFAPTIPDDHITGTHIDRSHSHEETRTPDKRPHHL